MSPLEGHPNFLHTNHNISKVLSFTNLSIVWADGTNPQIGAENRQPLPNPWQRGGGSRPAPNPPATGPALINTPGMQSLLQQVSLATSSYRFHKTITILIR